MRIAPDRWSRANAVGSRRPWPSSRARSRPRTNRSSIRPANLGEAGADVQHELVDDALAAALQDQLAAVVRAEARIAEGTYGRSVESGSPIPDERLEAQPLAERTVEEQSEYERSQR